MTQASIAIEGKKKPKSIGYRLNKKLTKWSNSFNLRKNQLTSRLTGHVRAHGRLFDLKHPRMIDDMRTMLIQGTYEHREMGMITRHVRPDDRVLELGVCIGATTMLLHDLVGSKNLIVFEADPRNIEMARHNFNLNNVRIRCENAVLVSGPDQPATVTFSSHENPVSSSLLSQAGTGLEFTVKTEDFESVVREHNITALVLDIEGGEVALFDAAGPMTGIRLIIMEAHERMVGKEANEQMLGKLEARGFEIVEDLSRKYIVLQRPGAAA